jgi:hypothetical protein
MHPKTRLIQMGISVNMVGLTGICEDAGGAELCLNLWYLSHFTFVTGITDGYHYKSTQL